MNGFLSCQVGVDFIGNERCNRCDKFGNAYKHFIGCSIYALLVFCHFLSIESAAGTSDVPVGKILCHEISYCSYSFHVVVLIHILSYICHEAVVFAENPSVKLRSLVVVNLELGNVYIVLVGVKDKEIIYISKCAEELAHDINKAVLVEFSRCPCR